MIKGGFEIKDKDEVENKGRSYCGAVSSLTRHAQPHAEVKKEWSYTSTPPICLDGMERDEFSVLRCKLPFPLGIIMR